jgi:hypothetical protein
MAVLTLPTTPSPRSATVRLISARNELTPAFGGAVQRLNRKGTRYAIDVELPPMTYVQGMAWNDIWAEADTVLMNVPQPGLDTTGFGSPLVNGSGQSGRVINLKGLTAGKTLLKGQYISIVTGGQRYLYKVASDGGVAGDGTTALTLQTLQRTPHLNNDVIEVLTPKIEGFARPSDDLFQIGVDRLVVPKFTIEERA